MICKILVIKRRIVGGDGTKVHSQIWCGEGDSSRRQESRTGCAQPNYSKLAKHLRRLRFSRSHQIGIVPCAALGIPLPSVFINDEKLSNSWKHNSRDIQLFLRSHRRGTLTACAQAAVLIGYLSLTSFLVLLSSLRLTRHICQGSDIYEKIPAEGVSSPIGSWVEDCPARRQFCADARARKKDLATAINDLDEVSVSLELQGLWNLVPDNSFFSVCVSIFIPYVQKSPLHFLGMALHIFLSKQKTTNWAVTQ